MSRYKDTKKGISTTTNTRNNVFEKYQTTIYKKVPERNDDILLISQEGDRLDNLAQQFYGNPHLWWFIAQTNNISTINVPAGTSLRIPISTKDASGN